VLRGKQKRQGTFFRQTRKVSEKRKKADRVQPNKKEGEGKHQPITWVNHGYTFQSGRRSGGLGADKNSVIEVEKNSSEELGAEAKENRGVLLRNPKQWAVINAAKKN